MSVPASRLPGFYQLSLAERRHLLAERFGLTPADLETLEAAGGLTTVAADTMVENAVGVLGLPLGLALNFVVDGLPVLVPMAVEEPSVVAACSHLARLAADGGGFTTSADPPFLVGQVQILDVPDAARALSALRERHLALLERANAFCPGLVERGGGVVDVRARVLPTLTSGPHADLDGGGDMLVVHLVVHTCDAMGANAVNTVVEGVAPVLAELCGGRARLRILTNLADERKARARMRVPFTSLADDAASGRAVAQGIVEAYRFAARDPYRACTHNKGIMNGIDAVAVATGNDWRALEAGAHAYAAREGRYTSLSRFWLDEGAAALGAEIELPMAVGVVGGSTRAHPTIQVTRKLLGPFADSVERLAGLFAAVGLAQNAAALKALATEGIQRGHMRLHARKSGDPSAHQASSSAASSSAASSSAASSGAASNDATSTGVRA
ncbi:MAG: hydroxymethylglutaryl-CoA reductase, degradative [Deltaproteobacteria bacterium]|nr:hydroxymethylglutaryl-CoA reductase, degradative [Deltaproteobacteria bacterium]